MAVDRTSGDRTELYIGLMSGTSLDGVDAVLADFSSPAPRVLAHAHRPFPQDLRAELLALTSPGANEIERSGIAAQRLVDLYAHSVADVLQLADCAPADICAIGAHGQTVRHHPAAGYSLQLNAPALLAELTQIDVVADFRSRDLAAGGQGAPLVPAFHAAAFSAEAPRAVVNIGGISNVTYLPDGEREVFGFDCGPGNLLLDAWAAQHRAEPFDRNGGFAATGRLDPQLLARLLGEPFLDSRTAQEHRPRVVFASLAGQGSGGLGAVAPGCAADADGVHRTLHRRCHRAVVRFSARCCRVRRWRPQCDADDRPGRRRRAAPARGQLRTRDRAGSGRSPRVRLAGASLQAPRNREHSGCHGRTGRAHPRRDLSALAEQEKGGAVRPIFY